MKRAKAAAWALVVVLAIGGAAFWNYGCQSTTDRTGRLLFMAAEESEFIESLQDRLTRQLNIADMLLMTQRKDQAIKTLALASTTLQKEEKERKTLDDFRRIAGWTSISELARKAGDRTMALTAADNAVEALNSVQPEAKRAEYVLSLSEEIKELRGIPDAAQLLEKGAKWSASILDRPVRRFALVSFTERLMDWQQYEAGQRALRQEPDPAWRADTLIAISRLQVEKQAGERGYQSAGMAPSLHGEAASGPRSADQAYQSKIQNFNKDVRYDSNFRQPSLQQGLVVPPPPETHP